MDDMSYIEGTSARNIPRRLRIVEGAGKKYDIGSEFKSSIVSPWTASTNPAFWPGDLIVGYGWSRMKGYPLPLTA